MQRWMLILAALSAVATVDAADVALVHATFSLEKHPEAGIDTYYEVVKRGLDLSAIDYDIVTDEQIVNGALEGHLLAIFPYATETNPEHTQAILDYVDGGGNVLWFFTVREPLQEMLGMRKLTYRRNEYEGQLQTMQFAADAPPGFPAQVRQESRSCYQATELTEGARVLADWLDAEGKSTGTPAVVMTDHSVWVAHVLWREADGAAQQHLLLATIGHFVPGTWERAVEGALGGGVVDTEFESFDALVADLREHPQAGAMAAEAALRAKQAREALGQQQYAEALSRATEAAAGAQQAVAASFPSRPHELRGVWMGFPQDDMDWDALMQRLRAANFNAVFPNMCTPGAAAYPSEVLPQITERDHLSECIESAHRNGIEVHPWRGNWQVYRAAEGVSERFFEEGRYVLSVEQAMGQEEQDQNYRWSRRWLDPSDERNRQLEIAAMEEMARNFAVDGIHYDFMRYPSSRYCYCDRCREQFEAWAGVEVANWPADCWEGGGHLARYRDWRRHLLTSLVAEIRERLATIKPDLRISLAARASLSGAVESDAQDWITWSHEGYLDFLCPMDYTGSVEQFVAKLEPQMGAVGGALPVYAGIGVSQTRSASAANLSQQIMRTRELGADGFLIFALSAFSSELIDAIGKGATYGPVDRLPHHVQAASALFSYPASVAGAAERTYVPDAEVAVTIKLTATGEAVQQITAQPTIMPARGGEQVELARYGSADGRTLELTAGLPREPGIYSLIARGEVVYADGHEEPFLLRSLPITVLSEEQHAELLQRLEAPRFTTDALHVGVVSGGYGSEGILSGLADAAGIEALPLHRLDDQFLSACDVVVLPQLRDGAVALSADDAAALREFVRRGGGLLVTHDVVGTRGWEALFPEVAVGLEALRETGLRMAEGHPLLRGMSAGEQFIHSYYDHVTVRPGEDGVVVAANEAGTPVVVAGEVGVGRYVAWGMATGLGADSGEVAPVGGEMQLLSNALTWLGGSD